MQPNHDTREMDEMRSACLAAGFFRMGMLCMLPGPCTFELTRESSHVIAAFPLAPFTISKCVASKAGASAGSGAAAKSVQVVHGHVAPVFSSLVTHSSVSRPCITTC